MTTEKTNQFSESEWSYTIEVKEIPEGGKSVSISADPEARKRLCKRLDIPSISKLTSDINLSYQQGGMVIHVQGDFYAELEQICGTTLEPVAEKINEQFEAWFSDPEQAISLTKIRHNRNVSKGERPMLDESEDPEPIVDGCIDLGELITQHISLSLDPYPHAQGVSPYGEQNSKDQSPSGSLKNPFAALKDWKDRQR